MYRRLSEFSREQGTGVAYIIFLVVPGRLNMLAENAAVCVARHHGREEVAVTGNEMQPKEERAIWAIRQLVGICLSTQSFPRGRERFADISGAFICTYPVYALCTSDGSAIMTCRSARDGAREWPHDLDRIPQWTC
jgi:hypothetical protein